MKSGKQRRVEIKTARLKRKAKQSLKPALQRSKEVVPVNTALLQPTNSYGVPAFVERGFYLDMPFICIDCERSEVWTATQQKWWYEVAKGDVFTGAARCRACRRRERERKARAREIHLNGLAKKQQVQA